MDWRKDIASKYNIFPNKPSYIPILIDDISRYVSQSNFFTNCIQEVEVVGEVCLIDGDVFLRSLNENSVAVIKLSLKILRHNENFPEALEDIGTLHPKFIRNEVVRVRGELKFKDMPLLEVHRVSKVEDAKGSHLTIALLSEIVQRQHAQYKSCPEKILQFHWKRMAESGKRIVKLEK